MANYPKLPPYKTCANYLTSKKIDTEPCRYPVHDVAGSEPIIDLLEIQAKYKVICKYLLNTRKLYHDTVIDFNENWKDLFDKELDLREKFYRYNTFVQDNLDKTERAKLKIISDKVLIEQREKDVEDLKAQYQELKNVKATMDEKIRDYLFYENFLNNVQANCEDFKSIDDIINKYESYMMTKKVLADRQEGALFAIENAHNEMNKLIEVSTLKIIGLYNQLANLSDRYDKAKSNSVKWEAIVTKIKLKSNEYLLQIQFVKESIYNTYLQICYKKNQKPEISKDDVASQCAIIKRYLENIEKLLSKIIKPAKGASSSKQFKNH